MTDDVRMEPSASDSESDGEAVPLPRLVVARVWTHLPTLLLANIALTVAALPAAALIVLGLALPSVLVAGLCLGPVWAATVVLTDRMVRAGAAGIGEFVPALRRFGGRGVRLGGAAGVIASVAAATLSLWDANPGHDWLLVPLFVDGTVLALVGLVGCVAFSLTTTDGLRGRRLLGWSLVLITRNPWPVAGTVGIGVLASFLVAVVPSILPLLPGPFAVLLSAVVANGRSALPAPDAASALDAASAAGSA